MSQALRIKELPSAERPRERLIAEGAEALSSIHLLAILLRTGTKGHSALDVAAEVINRHRTLDALSRATLEDLCTIKGVGRDKAVTLVAALTLARRMARETRAESPVLDSPDLIANLLREEVRPLQVEKFFAVLLNTRRRLIRVEPVSQGTLDSVLVHPRDVFKPAIVSNASALVLVHNHPSGDPTPSEADVKVTRDIVRAGQLLRIDVLDHVILGKSTAERSQDYLSLRELGYFY